MSGEATGVSEPQYPHSSLTPVLGKKGLWFLMALV